MLAGRLRLLLACAMAGFATAGTAQFALPDPEVFARPEDQERARLRQTPCAQADVDRGCYRLGSRLIRQAPCMYHIDPGTLTSIPVDQCYKMEPSRRHKGVWIDEFEGQAFIPEGSPIPAWPRGDPRAPTWREQFEAARAATIWIDVSRADLAEYRGRRAFIEFEGRKTPYPGSHGHMGMSGHYIIVDRVISLRACPETGACR